MSYYLRYPFLETNDFCLLFLSCVYACMLLLSMHFWFKRNPCCELIMVKRPWQELHAFSSCPYSKRYSTVWWKIKSVLLFTVTKKITRKTWIATPWKGSIAGHSYVSVSLCICIVAVPVIVVICIHEFAVFFAPSGGRKVIISIVDQHWRPAQRVKLELRSARLQPQRSGRIPFYVSTEGHISTHLYKFCTCSVVTLHCASRSHRHLHRYRLALHAR